MKVWIGLLWLIALPAAAQEITIYRCTDAAGALTVQNQPCPKGMRQDKKIMQTPSTVAWPAAPTQVRAEPAVPPKPVAKVPESPPPPVEKPAPPPLFECRRKDETRYLTEDLKVSSYCVPMQVTGLDGNPQTAAGDACEMVSDNCTPVADDALCAAWQQQLGEAESHWRFATPEHASERQQAYARVRDLVAASRCGDGASAGDTPAPQNP